MEELHEAYIVEKLSIEKPLKAERYKIKMQKKREHRRMNEAPKRKLLEEIGNAVSHGVGALIGVACLILMILKANGEDAYIIGEIVKSEDGVILC